MILEVGFLKLSAESPKIVECLPAVFESSTILLIHQIILTTILFSIQLYLSSYKFLPLIQPIKSKSNVFFSIIIGFMSSEAPDSFEVLGFVAHFTGFDEFFNKEEKKVPPPSLLTENMISNFDEKSKRKGRPKGKNAKEVLEKKQSNGDSGKERHRGHWTEDQKKKYHLFLEIHHRHFIEREMRRIDKIFKAMATFMETREAEQCRSHHQKMEKKHFTFGNILLHLRTTNYGSEYQQQLTAELAQILGHTPTLLSSGELLELAEDVEKTKKLESPLTQFELKPEPVDVCPSFDNLLADQYEVQLGMDFLI